MKSSFEILVESYQSTVTNQIILASEFGDSFDEKVLNHKLRKHCKDGNFRKVAIYLTEYTTYVGYPIMFTTIVDPDLMRVIKSDVYKSEIDGKVAYGYFKNEENTVKYFTSEVDAK